MPYCIWCKFLDHFAIVPQWQNGKSYFLFSFLQSLIDPRRRAVMEPAFVGLVEAESEAEAHLVGFHIFLAGWQKTFPRQVLKFPAARKLKLTWPDEVKLSNDATKKCEFFSQPETFAQVFSVGDSNLRMFGCWYAWAVMLVVICAMYGAQWLSTKDIKSRPEPDFPLTLCLK